LGKEKKREEVREKEEAEEESTADKEDGYRVELGVGALLKT
jgi:hypothetical protein